MEPAQVPEPVDSDLFLKQHLCGVEEQHIRELDGWIGRRHSLPYSRDAAVQRSGRIRVMGVSITRRLSLMWSVGPE